MLEPLSPSHIPDKLPEVKEDAQLKKSEPTGDSEGYSFNFFKRSKKRKQSEKKDESDKASVYNDNCAVKVDLSDEAKEKLLRQRELKKNRKNQE